ncbi:MAG: DUF1254 domain-containing protein [Bacteroidales bacterium]|nr:DUF1254 domain-containing protein [Bacteroidales bacterium]
MKKFFCLIALAAMMLTGCHDDNEVKKENDAPVVVTVDELKEAFYYTFPLVIMDATESVETNTEAYVPGIPRAPVNQLIHAIQLANASSTSVVTPNVDTYYTRLWMDLSEEPIVLEFPDVKDRFCNIQVLDAWTNTARVIYDGGKYVFALKGQKVDVPADASLVEMPTSLAWAIVRIVNKGEGDYVNVKKIQDAMKAYPLSAYGNPDYVAPRGTHDPARDVNPVQKCLQMSVSEYFNKANELMQKNPPLSFDTEILARLKKLGVGPGLKFVGFENDEKMFAAVKGGFKDFARGIGQQNRKSIGGIWSYFKEPIGDFGSEYEYRAAVALVGLGANTTEVAIYPRTDNDSEGNVLNGANTYVLHFSSMPPVLEGGFWSITAYGDNDYLIDNPINRYNVTDRSDYTLNPDGSLDVTLSFAEPQDGSFWLPTGDKGFHLFMRLYLPDLGKLDGWTPPTIYKK